jgi:hypothetical protein
MVDETRPFRSLRVLSVMGIFPTNLLRNQQSRLPLTPVLKVSLDRHRGAWVPALATRRKILPSVTLAATIH